MALIEFFEYKLTSLIYAFLNVSLFHLFYFLEYIMKKVLVFIFHHLHLKTV